MTEVRLIVAASVLAVLVASAGSAWTVAVNGHNDENGVATSVAFDAAGDIIAGGSMTSGGESKIGAMKLSRDGDVQWKTVLVSGTGYAAVAPSGDIGMAGTTWGGFGGGGDIVVAKLTGEDGEPLYTDSRTWVGNFWTGAVTVTDSGDIIAGVSGLQTSGSPPVFAVRKVSGTLLWQAGITIPGYPGELGTGAALGLAVGTAGQVFATGRGSGVYEDMIERRTPGAGLAVRLEVGQASVPACMQFGGEIRRSDGEGFEARSAPAPNICAGL